MITKICSLYIIQFQRTSTEDISDIFVFEKLLVCVLKISLVAVKPFCKTIEVLSLLLWSWHSSIYTRLSSSYTSAWRSPRKIQASSLTKNRDSIYSQEWYQWLFCAYSHTLDCTTNKGVNLPMGIKFTPTSPPLHKSKVKFWEVILVNQLSFLPCPPPHSWSSFNILNTHISFLFQVC